MGVSDLRDLAVIDEVSEEAYRESVVAVDAHNWLYRYLTIIVKFTDESVYTTSDGVEVPNLIGILQGVPKFLERDLLPVFVFDGDVIEHKEQEMAERSQRRADAATAAEAARERGDDVQARRLEARAQELTDPILESTREVLAALDLPIIDAPAEAEAQAASMARRGHVEYVVSEDYDTLLFGAPFTLRNLTSNRATECMDLAATLESNHISREQLVDIAILMGTDYNDGVYGYGPSTALDAIREYGDLEGILAAEDITVPQYPELRDLFLDPAVSTEYSIDTTVDPDLSAVEDYVHSNWEIPADELTRAFERLRAQTPFAL